MIVQYQLVIDFVSGTKTLVIFKNYDKCSIIIKTIPMLIIYDQNVNFHINLV